MSVCLQRSKATPEEIFHAGRNPAETRAQDGGNELIRAVVSEFERERDLVRNAGRRPTLCMFGDQYLIISHPAGKAEEETFVPFGTLTFFNLVHP